MEIANNLRQAALTLQAPTENQFQAVTQVLTTCVTAMEEAGNFSDDPTTDEIAELRALGDEMAALANTSIPIIASKRQTASKVPVPLEFLLRKLLQHLAGMVVDVIARRPAKAPPQPDPAKDDTGEHIIPAQLMESSQEVEGEQVEDKTPSETQEEEPPVKEKTKKRK